MPQRRNVLRRLQQIPMPMRPRHGRPTMRAGRGRVRELSLPERRHMSSAPTQHVQMPVHAGLYRRSMRAAKRSVRFATL